MSASKANRLPELVRSELDRLREFGLRAILFGGWAKELLGAWKGKHKDLDVLVVAPDIDRLDAFISAHDRQPLPEKRHIHKRGYLASGLPVELFLVKETETAWVTNCFGRYRHRWLRPLGRVLDGGSVEVVTPENILAYERNHHRVEEAFYEEYPEMRAEIERAYGDTAFPYAELFRWPPTGGGESSR